MSYTWKELKEAEKFLARMGYNTDTMTIQNIIYQHRILKEAF